MNKILVSRYAVNGRNEDCDGISEDGMISLILRGNKIHFEDKNDKIHYVEIEEKPFRDELIIREMEKVSGYKVYYEIRLIDNGSNKGSIIKVIENDFLREFQTVRVGSNETILAKTLLIDITPSGNGEIKEFTYLEQKKMSLIDMVDSFD